MKWWAIGLLLVAINATAEELRIGFGTHKPPYIFQGEQRGLEYDIVVAAARAGGMQVIPSYAPLERLHRAYSRGDLDGIASTRLQGGVNSFYTQPYISYQHVAIALSARNYRIERIADLGNYSIRAFQRARIVLGEEFQRMAEANPRYHEEAQEIARNRLLYSGRVDVVIGDRRVLQYFNREVYRQVDVSQPITEYRLFPPTSYQLGMRDQSARNRFDQGLAEIIASGEYAQIERRYAMY